MKNLIGLTLALALVVSVAPVMAEDSFVGMESLNSAAVALPDPELAKVEGQGVADNVVGDIGINVATITQLNLVVQLIVDALGSNPGANVQVSGLSNAGAATQQ